MTVDLSHHGETKVVARVLGFLAVAFALFFYLATPKATFAYEFWYVPGITALTGLVISVSSWLWPSWQPSTEWGRVFGGPSVALPLAMVGVANIDWASSFL